MRFAINYNIPFIKLLGLSLLSITLLFFPTVSYAEPTTSNLDNENEEDENMRTITTIRTKLNLNNVDTKNYDHIKIVGYLNGEGKVSYLDLKENNQKTGEINKNPLIIDLKFNKSNDVSSIIVDDEYFVCAYALKDKIVDNTNLPAYDCDEGNIGQSITTDTAELFSTMKKYNESNIFYKKQQNLLNDQIPEKIIITVNVPVYDAKDIEHINVVGMIKGEYNIFPIDVQNELKKGIENDRISVPFIFDRQTESGLIQLGDLFFGCVTSDEFPDQNSDCEKRILKDLNGLNSICARKDSSC